MFIARVLKGYCVVGSVSSVYTYIVKGRPVR